MLGMLLVGAVFGVARSFNVDPDLWWHIKTGELILSTHRWATTDPYSYTAKGMPWMSCEWLGDVIFAAVYRIGGLRGLEALLVVLASAVILALYAFATLRSGNSKAGFVAVAVLLTLANASFNLRPQMMGYLFLILTLIALERFRQGKQRAVWMLPVLFMMWINSHGSWIIGLGVVALYIACGLVSFPVGKPGSAALEHVGASAAGNGLHAFAGGDRSHAVWRAAGRVSVYGCVVAADQRGKHPGVAGDAVQSRRRQNIPRADAGIFPCANDVSFFVARI